MDISPTVFKEVSFQFNLKYQHEGPYLYFLNSKVKFSVSFDFISYLSVGGKYAKTFMRYLFSLSCYDSKSLFKFDTASGFIYL